MCARFYQQTCLLVEETCCAGCYMMEKRDPLPPLFLRWEKQEKLVKWSTEQQTSGQVLKRQVRFLRQRQIAKRSRASRLRLRPPSRLKHKRHPLLRWRASCIASMSGSRTTRRPQTGMGLALGPTGLGALWMDWV